MKKINLIISLFCATVVAGTQTAKATFTVTISSGTQVAAANIPCTGSTQTPVVAFFIQNTGTQNVTFTKYSFQTQGTFVAADVLKFQLWYNTVNTFAGSTQVGTDLANSSGPYYHDVLGGFTPWSQVVPTGTTYYYWLTADFSATGTVGNTFYISTTLPKFTFAATAPTQTISPAITAGGTQTIVGAATNKLNIEPPNYTILPVYWNDFVLDANATQATTNVYIHKFNVTANGNSGSGTVTNFSFTTAGSYVASDIVNFKIWSSSTNGFGTATLLATNATPGGPGVQTFPAFSQVVNHATGRFFWITMDVAAGAVAGHTITVSASASTDITTTMIKSGSAPASGTQTIIASAPIWSTNSTVNNIFDQGKGGIRSQMQIISDGSGGAIMVWEDDRDDSYATDIYAQRINSAGAVVWSAADGVPVCTAVGSQSDPQLVSDGSGGAVIVWSDSRSTSTIYAQRINASGVVQWTADGRIMASPTANAYWPQIVSDGGTGYIICWWNNGDTWAQRINSSGVVQWTANGKAAAVYDPLLGGLENEYPQMIADGAGGAIITWINLDYGASLYDNICAQRINSSGTPLWTNYGIPVCMAMDLERYPQIVSDGTVGGSIISWEDHRGNVGDYKIYAQRLDGSGNPLWTIDGVPVTQTLGLGDEYYQYFPNTYTITPMNKKPMIADGAGGAIMSWIDYRNSSWPDIYAQRISSTGTLLWGADGVAICTEPTEEQWNPTVTSDGTVGGAYITWEDYRNGSAPGMDVYAQRINASGVVQWVTDGIGVGTAAGEQSLPIAVTTTCGQIVAWNDLSAGPNYWGSFAQKIDGTGVLGGISCVLPVEMLSFTGYNKNNTNILDWKTASETNSDYYIIERGNNGNSFESIGKVKGAGNSNTIMSYGYSDNNYSQGVNYYRLKQVDFDGNYTYSKTISISNLQISKSSISIYPVPCNQELNYELYSEGNSLTNITVTDVLGNVVIQEQIKTKRGIAKSKLNIENLSEGVYFLRMENGTDQTQIKFIKQ